MKLKLKKLLLKKPEVNGYMCPVCKMSMDSLVPCERCGYVPPTVEKQTNEDRWVQEIKTLSTEELKERSEDDYNWTEKYRELCHKELKTR